MNETKKHRILLLTYKDHVPPSEIKAADLPTADWKLEHDVISTLKKMEQDLVVVGVGDNLNPVREAVEKQHPHIVFNLMDEFDGVSLFDQNVVSYLELMKVPYTGCNPRGLILARDKALSKKLLKFHGLPVPDFAVFPKNRKIVRPKELEFPLIVKSLTEEASLGISQCSIVHDDEKFKERVAFIHESVGTDAIVESFIEGRELYVGVWGNTRSSALPVWELFFDNTPDDVARIATRRAKWNPAYQKKYGIRSGPAQLSADLGECVQQVCLQAYRVLGLNGYARMDLRLSPEGKAFILEANPNPHIGIGEDFADSAKHAGISYEDMLRKILQFGLNWEPTDVRSI